MISIRKRLSRTLLFALLVLFILFSTSLYIFTHRAFIQQFDKALVLKTVAFAEMIELEEQDGRPVIELEFDQFPIPEFQPSKDAEYYQVWRGTGSVLARSPSLMENDLPKLQGVVDEPIIQNIRLPDGRAGRAAAFWGTPAPEPGKEPMEFDLDSSENQLLIVIAKSREDLDQILGRLLIGYLGMGLSLVVVLVLVVRYSVARGLSPLNRIAQETSNIDPRDLTHRFQTESVPEELLPVCLRLNGLLERLDAAFRRERRFNRDVSHELRTPLAELRTLAEVAIQKVNGGLSPISNDMYFKDVLDIAQQMESLVTVLLSLARCEANQQIVRRENIDFVDLIRKVMRPFQMEAEEKRLAVQLELPETAILETDPTLLSSLLANLVSNAVCCTPPGGMIHGEARIKEDVLFFVLRNTNGDLVPEDLNHLFEPFWQKDASRTEEERHGLGLSLVKEYADLLEIDVQCSLREGTFFQVDVLIPGYRLIDTPAPPTVDVSEPSSTLSIVPSSTTDSSRSIA